MTDKVIPAKKIWGEDFCLAASTAILAAGAVVSGLHWGWDNVRWNSYYYAIPAGLLFLVYVNRRLRSKLLGWGVFTIAFVCLLFVLGAFVITLRVIEDMTWWPYLGALSLYFFLLMTALYQLRPRWQRIPQGEKVP